MIGLIVTVLLLSGLFTGVFFAILFAFRRDLRELQERVEYLEHKLARPQGAAPSPEPASMPEPRSMPTVAAAAPPGIATTPAVVSTPALASTPAQAPVLPPIDWPGQPPRRDERPRRDEGRLEQQIGGIWMQNAGSVLLLLGAFFLIVWGYANGRIGPEILVLAGVILGIVVAWRGYVIGRTLTALGNAFVGVGLGVVYITLYLGHFRMHVFSGGVAFALLTLTSLVSVGIGLRRREPIIATLGSLAAYLPQLLAVWIPLQGFRLALPALLGYFAVVNVVVFALAASVGWSGLVVLSLVLTTVTWGANASLVPWGLGIQIALSALYVALGLAPVVRLVREEKRVRGIDIAVIAAAPMLLLIASFPFLIAPWRSRSGLLLAALSAIYLVISLWVEKRRREQDLWRPLTAASTVFLAAGIERGLLPEYLALAWCAQGTALLWLGLGERGAWFRRLGYAVLAVAATRLLYVLFVEHPESLLSAPAIRDLIVILALILASHLLGTARDRLAPEERYASGVWTFVANVLLMIWIFREADPLERVLPQLPRSEAVFALMTLAAAVWMVQCMALLYLSVARNAPVLRHIGYLVGGFAAMGILTGQLGSDPWRPGFLPLLNTSAIVIAFAAMLVILGAEFLARHRDRLGSSERLMPEIATGAANWILLAFWAREAGHLASVVATPGERLGSTAPTAGTLAAVFTSAAWTLQAVTLFALGWIRNSAFLRWSGLALFGLTVMKFLLVDLDRVDTFWRFVSALGIGVALLVVSFLYQRRARRSAEEPSPQVSETR